MSLFSKLFKRIDSELLEEEGAKTEDFDQVYVKGANGKLIKYIAPEEEEDIECSKQ